EVDGLNLWQARTIAEQRLTDRNNIFRLTGRFMDGAETRGRYDRESRRRDPASAAMDGDEAYNRALQTYWRKDERRVHDARIENPYTRANEEARVAAEREHRRGDRDEMRRRAEGREDRRRAGRERARDIREDAEA